MSILISGDFHDNARGELDYITREYLIKQYGQNQFDKINYQIILGDGGFLWPDYEEEEAWNLEVLSERPFPILCIIGNHEPVLGRPDLPELDIGIGEKVIIVNESQPFLAYLKRGKVYNIENNKILALGGALSVDKNRRTPDISWWEKEYWSEEEKTDLFNLLKNDNKFDYVMAHTGPCRINKKIFPIYTSNFDVQKYHKDEVSFLNEEIDKKIKCKQWFCGHWHKTSYYYCNHLRRGYQYLYNDTVLLSENGIIKPKNKLI